MNLNKFKPVVLQFNSTKNLYKGRTETDLSLEIYEYGSNVIEIKLINKNYRKEKNPIKKQFIYLIICFFTYGLLVLFKHYHLVVIDIIFSLWITPIMWRFSNLTESEKIIFCHDFGIHLQIRKFLGIRNRFVGASHIHDIVINEVLENLDFRYLLILRTKGILFHKRPIIPIFENFKPSYDCLSLIYKYLNNAMSNKCSYERML